MDYRIFIVSFPFLVSLIFTLSILIYDEYIYYNYQSYKDSDILETKFRSTYKSINYNTTRDINIIKQISNTLFLSSTIFLFLLIINWYI